VLHHRAFCDDIYGALRSVADVPTGSFTPFFPRHEIVRDIFDETLPFPFAQQVVRCYEGQVARLQDSFDHEMVTRIEMGRLRPLRHPNAPRYIHLDLSQGGDRTGFVMVHPSGHEVVERSPEDLNYDAAQVGETEVVKMVEVDFYLGITSGPYGEPIDYRKIRIFIDWLRKCGFYIRRVSADQYMSFDHLMRLREAGFETKVQSTDKTSKPYRDTRQATNEHRVSAPWPMGILDAHGVGGLLREGGPRAVNDALTRVILYQELTGLEHDVRRDKVDHRDTNPDGSKGSKDIADGLAGAVFECLTDEHAPNAITGGRPPREALANKYNRYLDNARG